MVIMSGLRKPNIQIGNEILSFDLSVEEKKKIIMKGNIQNSVFFTT